MMRVYFLQFDEPIMGNERKKERYITLSNKAVWVAIVIETERQ